MFRKKPQPGTQPVRPGLPVTGVPEDQPETIPDMTPTDQDIEGLFNGEGMPERFQDDPSKDAASAAFLRERGKAFGGAQGPIEGAPELYQEPGGIPFSETPEGKAFAAGDVMPPDPNAVASPQRMPGGIPRPTFPTPKVEGGQPEAIGTPPMTPQRMPGPGRPGVPMEAGEGDEPEAIPDAEGLDLSRLMPELGKMQRKPQPQIKEDVLDDLATMRPQDQGPPTDDDIVGLFEGRNVPVSQLSEEEARTQFDEMVAKFEEQPELPLTEEDEKRFRELLGMFRK